MVRARERDHVVKLLAEAQVVTLVGFGGMGKTWLARCVERRFIEDYKRRSYFVSVQTNESLSSLAEKLMTTLGFMTGADNTMDRLMTRIERDCEEAPLLFIVDACENAIDAAAAFVSFLAHASPDLKILCTSRQPLRLLSETLFRLNPLEAPEEDHRPSVERALRYDSIAFFEQQAKIALPSFALTADNLPHVMEICAQLDQSPLGIEAAAVRLRSASLESIARDTASIDDTLLVRHDSRSLAIDLAELARSSFMALTDPQQALFQRLAVFSSTFSLTAAIGICAPVGTDDWEVIHTLADLADRSLIEIRSISGTNSYYLLKLVRRFLLRQVGSEALETLASSRRAWCLSALRHLASRAPATKGPSVSTLLVNIKDFREVWTELSGDPACAADAASFLLDGAQFWLASGDASTQPQRLATLAEAENDLPTETRAMLLAGAADALGRLYQTNSQLEMLERVRQIAQGLTDRRIVGHLLQIEARARFGAGDTERATPLCRESIQIFEELGEKLGVARGLRMMGRLSYGSGQLDQAERYNLQALRLFETLDAPAEAAVVLGDLAEIAFADGDVDGALDLLARSRDIPAPAPERIHRTSNLAAYQLAKGSVLEARATAWQALQEAHEASLSVVFVDSTLHYAAARASDDATLAARLIGFVDANDTSGHVREYTERRAYESVLKDLSVLPAHTVTRLRADGAKLKRQEVLDLVTQDIRKQRPESSSVASHGSSKATFLALLSARELTIAKRIAEGDTNAQIADALSLSRRTVESHVANILRKCGLRSRVALASLVVSTIDLL